jgi:glyoxylase-like metal-dependent hydrolase (beta-lactamase superfamily II)
LVIQNTIGSYQINSYQEVIVNMKTSSFTFKLGEFSCWVINDGKVPIPDIIQKFLAEDNIVELDTLVLLVKTKNNTILFDTGWGIGAEAAPLAGLLTQNLETTGIRREEIDTIIFSHGHVDHIGGNIDAAGNPVFPNARYYMFHKEWKFWTMGSDLSGMPESIRQNARLTVQKNLIPLKDKINLFDSSSDIVPGISCMEAPGHSPGHIVLLVSSGSQRLLCFFDAFHRPIEIERPSTFLTPPMTGEAGASREKILSQIKSSDLIFAGHFSFPGLGHIILRDNVRYWQPIITD